MKTSSIQTPSPLNGQPLNEEASTRAKGILLMLGAVAAFTVSVLMLRSAGIAGSIWIATCMRYGIGLAIVTVIYLPRGQFKPLQLIRNTDLMMRGVLGCMGVYLFYATIPKLGAGVSTFISTTYVVLAPLFACIYLKEQLTLKQVGLMLMAMIGMFIMTGLTGASAPPLLYVIIGLIGAVLAAIVVVYIRKLTRTEHSSTIYAAQCFFGLLIGCGPALLQQTGPPIESSNLTAMLLSGVMASVGQLLMTFGYKYLPVTEGSLMALCAPVTIMAGGILFFGEPCSGAQMAGAGLILTASVLMTSLKRAPSAKPISVLVNESSG
ncbi:DMT family transporter [Pontiellaceae bacterium B12227]|nr:DMT family transporter [Pontiellaceae bacterium B12227]